VVRHGERIDEVDSQQWHRIRTQETRYDPPLTGNGWDQATIAGRKVRTLLSQEGGPVSVYSSPTVRTLSTASAIVSCLRQNQAPSVTPIYMLNCCAAAQRYGVSKAFPQGQPAADVMRDVALSCWPPLGDPDRVDKDQGMGGGFVESVKGLASTHADGDTIVLITHREGIWQLIRHVKGEFKSSYCNITLYTYDSAKRSLSGSDRCVPPKLKASQSREDVRSGAACGHPASTIAATLSAEGLTVGFRGENGKDVSAMSTSLQAKLASGEGTVMIHRQGRGGSKRTSLWQTPGVRGKWVVEGGAVPDGEIVALLSAPMSSDGDEGDFVLIRRASGIEGWTKVCNVCCAPRDVL